MQNRFVEKWVNGYWVIFDTIAYKNMELCQSRKQALKLLKG